jgi:Flp pilus assembly protein CpaB
MARREAAALALALAPRPKAATGIEDGERLVVVNIDKAAPLKPGDRADLVMVRKGYAETILSSVKVIALDKPTATDKTTPTDKPTATLAVAASDVPKVLLAEYVGKLSLAARDPDDASPASGSATDAELDKPVTKPPPPDDRASVTVIRAGVPAQYKVTKSEESGVTHDKNIDRLGRTAGR